MSTKLKKKLNLTLLKNWIVYDFDDQFKFFPLLYKIRNKNIELLPIVSSLKPVTCMHNLIYLHQNSTFLFCLFRAEPHVKNKKTKENKPYKIAWRNSNDINIYFLIYDVDKSMLYRWNFTNKFCALLRKISDCNRLWHEMCVCITFGYALVSPSVENIGHKKRLKAALSAQVKWFGTSLKSPGVENKNLNM